MSKLERELFQDVNEGWKQINHFQVRVVDRVPMCDIHCPPTFVVEFLHMLNDIADLIDNSDHLGTWNIFS